MREEREGWVSSTKAAGTHRNHHTHTNTTPARSIYRVAQSPPPRTITLNIHTNAWEDVQGPYRRRTMRALEDTAKKGHGQIWL